MYKENQTLKITATSTNPLVKIFGNRALIVTVIEQVDHILYVELSPEDAALHPRGRAQISFPIEQVGPTFYPDWTIEVVGQTEPQIALEPPMIVTDIEESKALAEEFEVGWIDPRDTGMMYDQPQPALDPHNMSIEQMVAFLDITPTYDTYIYFDLGGNLTSMEKPVRTSYPEDESESVGYVSQSDMLVGVMTAAEAASEFGLAEATVRQAINRRTIKARKSAGTWLIQREEADKRWGKK